ncbi:MAG: SIS domain-containing protein [Candidatus Ranarchaeia archaeon]
MSSIEISRRALKMMVEHARDVANSIGDSEILSFLNAIEKAQRIYLVGVGKTGLIAKSFAMSLLRADKESFVVGESLMPSPTMNDLIIAVSGSGESMYPIKTAKLGKQLGSSVIAITSNVESSLAKIADRVICIPGRIAGDIDPDYKRQLLDATPGGLLGALFEIGSTLFFNAIATVLQENRHKKK